MPTAPLPHQDMIAHNDVHTSKTNAICLHILTLHFDVLQVATRHNVLKESVVSIHELDFVEHADTRGIKRAD